jgi:hypothetical protein
MKGEAATDVQLIRAQIRNITFRRTFLENNLYYCSLPLYIHLLEPDIELTWIQI